MFLNFSAFAQKECEYDSDFTDSIGTYKSTKEYIIHERYFGNNKATLLLSLINAEGLLSVNVQIIKKNSEFIPAKCFNKNSKIYLQLENGKVITLVAIEQESCGEAISNPTENIRVLSGYFLFMKEGFEDLKKSPMNLIRIKFAGETEDFIIKSELKSELNQNNYYPQNYFINYLKCIE